MKANEVKKHTVLAHNGLYYVVREVEKSAPTARGGNTTYRIQMFSIPDGHKVDLSLRADDDLESVDLRKRETTFSYMDGEDYVFMDVEDYTQYILSAKIVDDMKGYIIEGVEGYYVSLIDENPIALAPPQSIVLEIVDTIYANVKQLSHTWMVKITYSWMWKITHNTFYLRKSWMI
ncbi:elongation factor P-like protein YeiP [Wohlfahrtiimonas populi]|uniref:elongation factor P-like protein YeiP n=1 Tax=Wohlfahrtiimonas populi TaxID=1940240 RepID=UPI001E2D1CBE|nr:elongation factor P-like protein YeiP [Wohlfahrtiimonas populi]